MAETIIFGGIFLFYCQSRLGIKMAAFKEKKKSHTWAPFSGISVSCTRQLSVSKTGQTAIFTTV
jgi:hypothetical protein